MSKQEKEHKDEDEQNTISNDQRNYKNYSDEEEWDIVAIKGEKTTCCRSYLTEKGRCFDCVEEKQHDPDEEEW